MRIVIAVTRGEILRDIRASYPMHGICNDVGVAHGVSLLTPHPGKLMDLIRILNENHIAYEIQNSPETAALPGKASLSELSGDDNGVHPEVIYRNTNEPYDHLVC